MLRAAAPRQATNKPSKPNTTRDWGPAFAPSGLHGGVKLLGYDAATLRSLHVDQRYDDAARAFNLHVEAELLLPEGGDHGV